ncbi:MAG TPA: hypothetical protein PLB52_01950 [Candidatus Moranbacteria bacterium]|nr:hypothetical protein [Candidatus Moranbacteria bacterium]
MKNKKGNIVVITVIIIIVAITAGVIGWLFAKKSQMPIQQNITQKPATTSTISTQSQVQDTILVDRNNEIYEINLATKELKPYNNPFGNLAEFSGLPKEIKNNQISISNRTNLLSKDENNAIIVSITYDETKTPSEFDGSLPILKAEEFICETATKKCSSTDILASAYNATGFGGNWYGYSSIWWYGWDTTKNLLYGHLTGEGVGNASPVYIFDINKKALQQTTGYNSLNDKEKRAEIPAGAFSPSFAKFIMVNENWNNNNSGNKWDLLLYDSTNLSAPLKKFDISTMNNGGDSRVSSVAWSADEKTLVLETGKQIFTLNLDTGKIDLIYTDTTKDSSGLWLDFNAVDLSQNGRYIVFVDYDNRTTPVDENKMETVLKAIDLQNNNSVIELLREEGLTLDYRF